MDVKFENRRGTTTGSKFKAKVRKLPAEENREGVVWSAGTSRNTETPLLLDFS
jgi:hypothetical protein